MAIAVAQRVLAGELSILLGCRQLARLSDDLVDDWCADQDFGVFGAIESETDHLPLEDERETWNPVAFENKQREVVRFEKTSREEVLAACRSIIARFVGA